MKPKANAMLDAISRAAAGLALTAAFAVGAPAIAQTAQLAQSDQTAVNDAPATTGVVANQGSAPAEQSSAPAEGSPTMVASNAPTSTTATTTTPRAKPLGSTSHAARVEGRIAELRSKLKITPDQEERWNQVVQIMRENAKSMDALAQERMANRQQMTAVDDLNAYSEFASAHAEGLKKLVPAFDALYNSLSDAQKKQADATFHTRAATRMAAAKSKSRS